jgi:hypothetical protein
MAREQIKIYLRVEFMTEQQPQKLSDNELLASIYTLFAEMEKKTKLLEELKQEAEKRKLI